MRSPTLGRTLELDSAVAVVPDHDVVLEIARDLSELQDAETFHALALERLSQLIPADHVFWTRTDFVGAGAEVRSTDPGTEQLLGESLGRFGLTHPAIQTYVENPADLAPRRISDVVDRRAWHRTPIFGEAFAGFGEAHQLSLVCSVTLPGTGTGWTFTRSGSDFDAVEVDLAARLLPVLLVLDRMYSSLTAAPVPLGSAPGGTVTLTPRESEVICVLAEGLTAHAIGHRLAITERTVRKHLASIYEKLDCGDRLVAVSRARTLGLVPESSASRPGIG